MLIEPKAFITHCKNAGYTLLHLSQISESVITQISQRPLQNSNHSYYYQLSITPVGIMILTVIGSLESVEASPHYHSEVYKVNKLLLH